MTYQQRLDQVSYPSLSVVTLRSATGGSLPITCRFATPNGNWVTGSFELTLTTSASALTKLWQNYSGSAYPEFPAGTAVITLSATGLYDLGFNAVRDGSISASETPTIVRVNGAVRLGPDVIDEQTKQDGLTSLGTGPYTKLLSSGTFMASSFAQAISGLQHPERKAISLTYISGSGTTYFLMRNIGDTEEVTTGNYWTYLSPSNVYIERMATNNLEFRCITNTGSMTFRYEVLG